MQSKIQMILIHALTCLWAHLGITGLLLVPITITRPVLPSPLCVVGLDPPQLTPGPCIPFPSAREVAVTNASQF